MGVIFVGGINMYKVGRTTGYGFEIKDEEFANLSESGTMGTILFMFIRFAILCFI